MKIKNILMVLVLFGAFISYSQQVQAQNPIVDLGAKGAAAVGGGLNAVIQTCINTIGASGGLLGAILSVVLSMLNGLISLVMSVLAAVGLGGVAGFCAGAIMGCISGIVGLISAGIVEILDILQAAGRGIDTLCTGVCGGLIIVFIVDIILTIWQFIGYLAIEIWFGVKWVVGGIAGFFGFLIGLIPIIAVVEAIAADVLMAIWLAIYLLIMILGVGLPIGINAVVSGGVAVWSGEGWYIPILHSLDFAVFVIVLDAFLASTMGVAITGTGAMSWCGGIGAGYTWLADMLIISVAGLIVIPITAIISLILFALRWYSILPTCYRFCVNTLC